MASASSIAFPVSRSCELGVGTMSSRRSSDSSPEDTPLATPPNEEGSAGAWTSQDNDDTNPASAAVVPHDQTESARHQSEEGIFPPEIAAKLDRPWHPAVSEENLLSPDVEFASSDQLDNEVDDLDFKRLAIDDAEVEEKADDPPRSAPKQLELPPLPVDGFVVGDMVKGYPISQGAFAKTWEMQCCVTGRVVCVKSMHKIEMAKKYRSVLFAEIRAYKRIADQFTRAPYIMQCHGFLQEFSYIHLVLECMERDMMDLIHAGRVNGQEKRWIAQTAVGIDALHKMGILHRDIKPENLLVDAQGNITISDFGCSYVHDRRGPLWPYRTYCDEYIGTDPYTALEVHNRQPYGVAVDWWSLGCVLFDLLAGCYLFDGEDERCDHWRLYERWDELGDASGPSYPAWRASRNGVTLTKEQDHLICALIRKDPKHRYRFATLALDEWFVDENGKNLVLEARAQAAKIDYSSLKNIDEPFVPDTRPETYSLDDPVYNYPSYIPTDGCDGLYRDLGWINPKGMWGDLPAPPPMRH